MSNETKVGILAVVAIAIFVWGYNFLKGKNILSSSTILYAEYEEVNMLANSTPVYRSGFQVGVVSDMYLNPENMRSVIVVLTIEKGVNVPKEAIAEIVPDVTGGRTVNLSFSKPCSEGNCAESGDYIQGKLIGLLNSMIPQNELQTYLSQIGGTVGEVYDTLNNRLTNPNTEGIGKTFRQLSETIANLSITTSRLNALIASSSGDINKTMANVAAITENIKNNNEQISKMMENMAAFSDQLKGVDLAKTVDNANTAIASTTSTMDQLKTTLGNADTALGEVTGLIADAKGGKGTLGKLITDDELYYKLSSVSQQIEAFLKDLEESPYRYIPLKSRNKIKRYDRKDGKE